MRIKKGLTFAKNIYTKLSGNKTQYKQYASIVKDWNKRLNTNGCTKIEIEKTGKRIVSENGFEKETLETLQTTEFIEKFHTFLYKKGYEKPKTIWFMEDRLPRKSGLAGESFGSGIIYNPRCINILDFRIPIHETGHLSRHLPTVSIRFAKDNYLYSIGAYLKKIPFVKNLFKEHTLCHLSKKEQIALKADYARAFKEGYFKHNPFHELSKERITGAKTGAQKDILRQKLNRLARDFRKNPEEYYLPNSLLNREEFIADYYNLAAQGFEFSPIVTARYLKYGGPKFGEIITKKELENFEKLRKEISHKSLQDYGYTWQA